MSYKVKFILLALFNSLLIFGFLYGLHQLGVDLRKRLIDLNLSDEKDFKTLMLFGGTILTAFLINLLILLPRKREVTEDEFSKILHFLGSRV